MVTNKQQGTMTHKDNQTIIWYRFCLVKYKAEIESIEQKLKVILDKYEMDSDK